MFLNGLTNKCSDLYTFVLLGYNPLFSNIDLLAIKEEHEKDTLCVFS
ncbi:hypothetical protein AB751O23_AQ_00130 [Chlamydiales bacterium SCGC AB-751-O23]|nr:hypothetical protein AB751O23_AQ_00130 [Chlamydiales bacterium SCGC AB-751-O23]